VNLHTKCTRQSSANPHTKCTRQSTANPHTKCTRSHSGSPVCSGSKAADLLAQAFTSEQLPHVIYPTAIDALCADIPPPQGKIRYLSTKSGDCYWEGWCERCLQDERRSRRSTSERRGGHRHPLAHWRRGRWRAGVFHLAHTHTPDGTSE
jgi:hypothetical protein